MLATPRSALVLAATATWLGGILSACGPILSDDDGLPGDGDGDSPGDGDATPGTGGGDPGTGGGDGDGDPSAGGASYGPQPISLGPRPRFLVDQMEPSALRDRLTECDAGPFEPSPFSIGHRGACLQFPEHTQESYVAAARQGAGIIECDVTFTKDKELVCRHSQCDLHTTTNILLTDLATKCTEAFSPAQFDEAGNLVEAATATCCTSDITLDEYRTLCAKMDGADAAATTPEAYVMGTPSFRTDLYSTCGTLMTHQESIALIDSLGAQFTPELKIPSVAMPFRGMSQSDFAQKMIDEYKALGIDAARVWAQSFRVEDVYYWIENEPSFGRQAVFLDDVDTEADVAAAIDDFSTMRARGVNVIAPPLWALVTLDGEKIVPSSYAQSAQDAGFDIITWTFDRSGPLASGGGWYFQSIAEVTDNDGVYFELLDVLAKDVGVIGIFSDWPADVTYYANCMGL